MVASRFPSSQIVSGAATGFAHVALDELRVPCWHPVRVGTNGSWAPREWLPARRALDTCLGSGPMQPPPLRVRTVRGLGGTRTWEVLTDLDVYWGYRLKYADAPGTTVRVLVCELDDAAAKRLAAEHYLEEIRRYRHSHARDQEERPTWEAVARAAKVYLDACAVARNRDSRPGTRWGPRSTREDAAALGRLLGSASGDRNRDAVFAAELLDRLAELALERGDAPYPDGTLPHLSMVRPITREMLDHDVEAVDHVMRVIAGLAPSLTGKTRVVHLDIPLEVNAWRRTFNRRIVADLAQLDRRGFGPTLRETVRAAEPFGSTPAMALRRLTASSLDQRNLLADRLAALGAVGLIRPARERADDWCADLLSSERAGVPARVKVWLPLGAYVSASRCEQAIAEAWIDAQSRGALAEFPTTGEARTDAARGYTAQVAQWTRHHLGGSRPWAEVPEVRLLLRLAREEGWDALPPYWEAGPSPEAPVRVGSATTFPRASALDRFAALTPTQMMAAFLNQTAADLGVSLPDTGAGVTYLAQVARTAVALAVGIMEVENADVGPGLAATVLEEHTPPRVASAALTASMAAVRSMERGFQPRAEALQFLTHGLRQLIPADLPVRLHAAMRHSQLVQDELARLGADRDAAELHARIDDAIHEVLRQQTASLRSAGSRRRAA